MYRYAFFDLDGTLTDSSEGIINSIKYSLKKNGYPIPDETELLKFIGPPLADSFAGYLNLPKDQVQDMVDTYREYFAVKGLFENRVYDGAFKVETGRDRTRFGDVQAREVCASDSRAF